MAAIRKYYGLSGLKNRGSKSKIKVLAWSFLLSSLSLTCRWLSSSCVLQKVIPLFMCTPVVSLCVQISSSNQDNSQMRLWLTQMTPFNLNYLYLQLWSHSELLVVGAWMYGFSREHSLAHNPWKEKFHLLEFMKPNPIAQRFEGNDETRSELLQENSGKSYYSLDSIHCWNGIFFLLFMLWKILVPLNNYVTGIHE